MVEVKKYLTILKSDLKRFFYNFKSLFNKDVYKKESIVKANINLGIEHLRRGNINDAIFKFYIVSRFFDKSDKNAKYFLAWSYLIKNDVKRALKELEHIQEIDNLGLREYLLTYKSCDMIPDQIIDTYKNFTSKYLYGRYFDDKTSLSKLLVDNLLSHLKTIPKECKILDLGCKSGLIGVEIDYAINKQYKVLGVENNEILYQMAKELSNKENIRVYDEVLNSDIESYLSNLNTQYDIIISFDSLSYRRNLQDIFQKIKSNVKKDGCFIFLLKKSNITQISNDKVSFEYQESDIRNQLADSKFSIVSIKNYKIRKNEEYFIVIAN